MLPLNELTLAARRWQIRLRAFISVYWHTLPLSFLRAGAIVALGNALVALIGIAALRLYTELAPTDIFGSANLIISALSLGLQVLVVPIVNVQLRYHSEAVEAGRGDQFTAQTIRWALIPGAALAFTAVCVVLVGHLTGRIEGGLPTMVAVVLWSLAAPLRHVLIARLNAEQRMTTYMALRVVEAAATGLVTWLALRALVGTPAFVWGQVAGFASIPALLTFLAPWPIWRSARESGSGRRDHVERIWRYGAPFAPMAVLIWLAHLGDRYVLAAVAGTAVTGHYLAAFTIASAGFVLLNGVMGDLFRPRLFAAEGAGRSDEARRVFLTWLATYIFVSLCGLSFILLLGEWIVRFALAEPYRAGAVGIMFWIALGYAINGVTIGFENRIFSLGQSARVLLPIAVGALANILLSLILIPWHGAMGAAEANCGSFALQFLLTLYALRRMLFARSMERESSSESLPKRQDDEMKKHA